MLMSAIMNFMYSVKMMLLKRIFSKDTSSVGVPTSSRLLTWSSPKVDLVWLSSAL